MKAKLFERYGRSVKILDDSFGSVKYLISIGCIGNCRYLVHAGCLQDAIDFIVELDSQNIPGFIADKETTKAYWDKTHEDHLYALDSFFPAGNAGELFTNEIVVIAECVK